MKSKSTIGKGGRFDSRERDFVRSVYPGMGPAAIAKKLGRSKSGICNLIREMKATGEIDTDKSSSSATEKRFDEPLSEGDGTQDTLGRLKRLRDMLYRQLYDAGPGQIARISAEYRAVVDEIDKIESSEGSDEDDVIDKLAGAIAQKFGQA